MKIVDTSINTMRQLPLFLALIGALGAAPLSAQQAPQDPTNAAFVKALNFPAQADATNRNAYQLSLRTLGAGLPIQLRGVEGSQNIPFSIRADEVVTGATLKLNYAYSPALISELSHINVYVNDEIAASIPVPHSDAGKNLTRDIPIPTRLITEFNRLKLQLIGHYTLECEDPTHSSLWANISNQSLLELQVSKLTQANDLALLPHPFFDHRDIRRLDLPFVLGKTTSNGVLEAAGSIASWFGTLASYRGATFPSSNGQLPAQGNAVVIALSNESIPGVHWQDVNGPTIAVTANPNDPQGKLLLVLGRTDEELKIAARALSTGGNTLTGQVATITDLVDVRPRKPYDAPNWLPSDRPVKFGELAAPAALTSTGYDGDTIRVNMRIPPDLFAWKNKQVPLHLKYRYTPRTTQDKSSLNLNVNEQFLASYPLPGWHLGEGTMARALERILPDGTVPVEEKLRVPLYQLPARSQLQFDFYYEYIKQGACKDVLLDNVEGAIDPESTIDISSFPHFLAMPDLSAFSNTGFPFTRMADLSETAVILPDTRSSTDIASYLTLMGWMGESTGYPAYGVRVGSAQQVSQFSNKDLLIMASGDNQPLLKEWASHLPIGLDGNHKRFQLSDTVHRLFFWWKADVAKTQRARQDFSFRSAGTDALIAGFESPLSSRRSAVLVGSNQPEGLKYAVAALLNKSQAGNINGAATVVRGEHVESVLSEQTYYVGRLGPLVAVQWFLSRSPLLLALLAVIGAALLGSLIYLALRARARQRLRG